MTALKLLSTTTTSIEFEAIMTGEHYVVQQRSYGDWKIWRNGDGIATRSSRERALKYVEQDSRWRERCKQDMNGMEGY